MTTFKKAIKSQSRLRLALYGVSGSGKTYTALTIATALGRVAVIDTERGSASKYADLFAFDVLEMQPPYSPSAYVAAIKAAEGEGYDVLVIDSLSHAWAGTGGALEMVDSFAKRSQSGNSFVAWREVTPEHNKLVDAIVQSRCHVISTMRAKTEYVLEEDSRGKKVPRKKALAPVQRDGMEYEFDVVAEMDADNTLIVQKSRYPELSGRVINKPDAQVAAALRRWLDAGTPAPTPAPANAPADAPSSAPANAPADAPPSDLAKLREKIADLAKQVKTALPSYVSDVREDAEAALRQARAVYARDDASADDLRAVVARLEGLL